MGNQVLISAKNLAAGYSSHPVWSAATFSINKGEFVGILGPNGSGKTTLFKLLLGLLKPTRGSLEIFGEQPKRGNFRIGYVPQSHPVDKTTPIVAIELVRLGLFANKWGFSGPRQHAKEQKLARDALRLVGAEQLAMRSIGQLSGGELQRVFLAQALVGKPDMLLLDEPLANLDIRREIELVKLINTVAKTENVAILLIAHDINPLLPVVDRLIYMVQGRIASGKPDQVINSKSLSKLYGVPVEVLRDSRGRLAVLGTEEVVHHD